MDSWHQRLQWSSGYTVYVPFQHYLKTLLSSFWSPRRCFYSKPVLKGTRKPRSVAVDGLCYICLCLPDLMWSCLRGTLGTGPFQLVFGGVKMFCWRGKETGKGERLFATLEINPSQAQTWPLDTLDPFWQGLRVCGSVTGRWGVNNFSRRMLCEVFEVPCRTSGHHAANAVVDFKGRSEGECLRCRDRASDLLHKDLLFGNLLPWRTGTVFTRSFWECCFGFFPWKHITCLRTVACFLFSGKYIIRQ